MTLSTFPVTMAVLLFVSLFFLFAGGHIAVLVTDCLQGMFTQIAAVIIVIVLVCIQLDWGNVVEVLISVGDPDKGMSLLNPLKASNQEGGFTFWFFMISIVAAWYNIMSNMQSQAYIASAKTAHEYRMGSALNQWRWQALLLFFMVLVLCAMVVLHHPDHAATSVEINKQLDAAVSSQPIETQDTLRKQLTITMALSHIMPVGLAGLFCAIMLAALISTYDSFMHTWGVVFLQDVIMPFRKKRFETKTHLWLLRLSIFGVAAFSFFYSMFFPNTESLLMYFALVNSIWLGGSGAVILGGLYWKRGTNAAAFWTLILGAVMGSICTIVKLGWPKWYDGATFPINAQWLFLITIVVSVAVYWIMSLMGNENHNMDKLLNRGKYAIEGEQTNVVHRTKWYEKMFGIGQEFNFRDRVTAYSIVGWLLMWLGVFIAGMIYGFVAKPGEEAWAKFWYVYLICLFGLSIVTTLLFTIGGLVDIESLFKSLKTQKHDYDDDGMVIEDSDK